jgi:biotin carboxyl carrier protein
MAGDRDELAAIVALLAAATFTEFRLETPEVQIVVRRTGADAAPAGDAVAANDARSDGERHVVTAPLLGIFRRAGNSGGPPLVEVGDVVDAAAVICVLEVLGRAHRVSAGRAGIVRAVLASEGAFVEFGAPLFVLAPDS